MLQCLVNDTLKVLPCPEHAYPTAPETKIPSLFTFISRLVKNTSIYTGTLMATLVYLRRLHKRLPPGAVAQDPSTRHRIFLACLILSSKFHNDTLPKNKHWARYTDGLFDIAEVNEMERQLLLLLDWDVLVSESDLFACLGEFLSPIMDELASIVKLQSFLIQQEKPPAPPQALQTAPQIVKGCRPSRNAGYEPEIPDTLPDLPPIQLNLPKRERFGSIHYVRLANSIAESSTTGSLDSLSKSGLVSSIFSSMSMESVSSVGSDDENAKGMWT